MDKKTLSLIEVVVFYSLVHLLLWGSGWFRPPVLIAAALMIGICVGSNRLHRDTREKIGFSKNTFWPALKFSIPFTLPVLIILLILIPVGGLRGSWSLWFALFGYPVWGLAQDYALLGFVANRLENVLPEKKKLIPFINASLFSLAHLPNPILMGVTFYAGFVFTMGFSVTGILSRLRSSTPL